MQFARFVETESLTTTNTTASTTSILPTTTKPDVSTPSVSTSPTITNVSSTTNRTFDLTSKIFDSVSSTITPATTTDSTIIGPCRYSTFYESKFDGRKLIDRTVVGEASLCFQHCAQKRCRSANLQNFLGKYKYCEIFSDAAVDYPSINYLTYSSDSVYFDGIQCQENIDSLQSQQQQKPLFIVI